MSYIEDIRNELYSSGKELYYSNMVGQDHLIKTADVKQAIIKNLIKKYYVVEDFSIDELDVYESVEMQLLYFGIGLKRLKSFEEKLQFIDKNANIARSWMTTDLCNQYLKNNNFAVFKPYFLKFKEKHGEYEIRFAYVIGLLFYKDMDNCKFFLDNFIKDDRYYVMMSMAWLLSYIAITDFEGVVDIIKSDKITLICKKKAISKIIDSFRISDEKKNYLRELRKELK